MSMTFVAAELLLDGCLCLRHARLEGRCCRPSIFKQSLNIRCMFFNVGRGIKFWLARLLDAQ